MKIPDNMSEEQVIEVILKVSQRLAPKYKFGSYEPEDIAQEAFIIACKAMDEYDGCRPLENFLAVVLSRRLKNFVRDNHLRYLASGSTKAEHEEWEVKYGAKKNLIEPLSIDNVDDEHEGNMWTKIDFLNDIQAQDIFTLIDKHLPVHIRADFLRMKQGMLIPKPRREKIEAIIITILAENGYETW